MGSAASTCQHNPSVDSDSQRGIRVWLGSLKLERNLPSRAALRELLYGDSQNSAKDADVIAILVIGLAVSCDQVSRLRHLLKGAVDESEKYLFNEDDKGLAIRGAPVQLVEVLQDLQVYNGLYVAVDQRFVASGEEIGNALSNGSALTELADDLANLFITPPMVTCNVQAGGQRADEYYAVESILLQDVVLRAPFGVTHLLLCGANLSSHPALQLKQVAQLERQLQIRRRGAGRHTVLLFGDLGQRVVCSEDFTHHIEKSSSEDGKKEVKKRKHGSRTSETENEQSMPAVRNQDFYRLSDSGVAEICSRLQDPAARRRLLSSDSLHFIGEDCFGHSHRELPLASRELLRLFDLSHDWLLQHTESQVSKLEVPMPTCQRTPLDTIWREALGFRVRVPEVITMTMLRRGVDALKLPENDLVEDLQELYLPDTEPQDKSHARVLKTNLGDALYMQMGWLDGLGVYRHGVGCRAELVDWQIQEDVLSFDHVPVKGSVLIHIEDGSTVRVWVGSIKLDGRSPSLKALRHFLYSSTECSARDADVIALFLTDVDITKQNVKQLQHLLATTLGEERGKYIFNEEEEGLVLKAIPVQLVKAGSKGNPRYIGLHICVKKELVACEKEDGGSHANVGEAFPEPPELICRSDMKNEAAPSFKGHMAQKVVIKCPKGRQSFHLLLVGLNFDTEDGARARQVERFERHLCTFHGGREEFRFAAIVFGDFNGRMVCPTWLKAHVSWSGEGGVKGPVLSVDGSKELCTRLTSPRQRLELMETVDSWAFNGEDATGQVISVPNACRRLQELFQLHRDICKVAPLPTYKRAPIGDILSRRVGFPLEVFELITCDQLEKGFTRLREVLDGVLSDLRKLFFFCDALGSLENEQRRIDCAAALTLFPHGLDGITSREVESGHVHGVDGEDHPRGPLPLLACGWPDGVGIYRHSMLVKPEFLAFGTCEEIVGGLSHVPIRASVRIAPAPLGGVPKTCVQQPRTESSVAPVKLSGPPPTLPELSQSAPLRRMTSA